MFSYQFHAKVFARKNFSVEISYQLSVIKILLQGIGQPQGIAPTIFLLFLLFFGQ